MSSYELHRVDRVTAGAVGEPGRRTFFLQARKGDQVVSVVVEKQQVELLAEAVDQLLDRVDLPEPDPPEDDLELEEPLEPAFRAGQIALGYDADEDLILVQCDELADEEEDEASAGSSVRLWATRGQMRALAEHAAAVVAAGRPTCRMCGGPVDPEGHFCPPSNGHRLTERLP